MPWSPYDADKRTSPADLARYGSIGRDDYNVDLMREVGPNRTLTPTPGRVRRCRTGFVLSSDQTCDACGVSRGQPCQSKAGTV